VAQRAADNATHSPRIVPEHGRSSQRDCAPLSQPAAAGLAREVGPWSLIALTINCVVGAGVLGLPGQVFALAGRATPFVLGAAGVLAAAVALCLAELAGRFDGPGGPAIYLDRAFGPAAGFFAGWLLWSATVLGAASLLDLLVGMLGQNGPARPLALLLVAALMTGLTLCGARRSTAASAILTVLKLILLAGVVVVGLTARAAPAHPPSGPAQASTALMLVFFAFIGFERPTALAGEVRNPRRNVPIALLAAMATIGLLYAGVFAACLRDLPDLASSAQPVHELAIRTLGAPAAFGLKLGAAIIILGTLTSQWITAPRLLLALADEGRLPGALARLAPHRRTPDLAILITGVSALSLALVGGFRGAATASSAARLLIFFGCGAAVLRLRSERTGASSGFRLPGGGPIAVFVSVACFALLATALQQLSNLAVIMVIGGLSWLSTAWSRRQARLTKPPA
jgi:basic amino acid/polyamine antiporter, APA family